ncbi:MAG: serine hydrolase domain-containing protein [Acidimicrobiales bacterium]
MAADALSLIDAWPGGPRAAATIVAGEITAERGDVWVALAWASVTKLATALATMIAVDLGAIRLDQPAGPPGSTVRHLLAHASGLAFDTPTVRAPPGARRIYSNSGYEALAETVAAAVGCAFGEWLTDRVFEPLGMTSTRLDGSPASGIVGPLADLVGLAGELQRPDLVSGESARAMRTVAFPGLAGLLPGLGHQAPNDWGLGPEIRANKSPHWTGSSNDPSTFGHFGAAGGFVWIDPVAGVACAALTSADFGPWARVAWPVLADAVIASA